MSPSFSYEDCKATSDWLMAQTDIRPIVGIVCGSGLGGLADILKDQVAFNYKDIPNFPQSTGEFGDDTHTPLTCRPFSVHCWFLTDWFVVFFLFCSARACRTAGVRHPEGEAMCVHAGAFPLVRGLPNPEGVCVFEFEICLFAIFTVNSVLLHIQSRCLKDPLNQSDL